MKLATLAVIVCDGKLLLGEKKRGEIGTGMLNGPGGKVEPGETPEECVIRETREELGIELDREALDRVGMIRFHTGEGPSFAVHIYRTGAFTGELKETDEMIPSWYPTDHLPYERMFESDRLWLPKALAGEYFDADAYYDGAMKDFRTITFHPTL